MPANDPSTHPSGGEPISFLIGVYNEEERIADVLRHAVLWADEVIVIDKESTDATRSICAEFGAKVRVVEAPFTPQGHDDAIAAARLPRHRWIWIGTASEVPTPQVVAEARRIITQSPDLDLVYVPRKLYSFGFFSPQSPWGVKHYPFLINRDRALIRNLIHRNFEARDEANTRRIPVADDCCVHHFTHPTAARYADAMRQYFAAECDTGDAGQTIAEALKRIRNRPPLESLEQDELLGLECAWQFYWLGTALFAWDKRRGNPGPKLYARHRRELLATLWNVTATPVVAPEVIPPSRPPAMVLTLADGAGTPEALLQGRPICQAIHRVLHLGAHAKEAPESYARWLPGLREVLTALSPDGQPLVVDLLRMTGWSNLPAQTCAAKLIILDRLDTDTADEVDLRTAVHARWGDHYIFLGTVGGRPDGRGGAAIFCAEDRLWLLYGGPATGGAPADAKHEAARRSWWARGSRRWLPEKLRRSLRKRLSRVGYALND